MGYYRLLKDVGPHMEKGVEYQPGQVVEADTDLEAKFGGKFETVEKPKPLKKKKTAAQVKKEEVREALPGKDVSGKFADLPDGITVRKDGRMYAIYQDDVRLDTDPPELKSLGAAKNIIAVLNEPEEDDDEEDDDEEEYEDDDEEEYDEDDDEE